MSLALLLNFIWFRFITSFISFPENSSVISHEIWDSLLSKCVLADGRVNYRAFVAQKEKLQSYLDLLQSTPPQTNWSRYETIAYWINTYNAYTVKLIVDHYPVNSIKEIDNGDIWDKMMISAGDQTYSLNNIENDILRKKLNDPRIHFAINCASQSCPRLFHEAFTGGKLDRQLHEAATGFINDPSRNRITADKIEVSQIFSWYKEDFTKQGTLIDFLNRYSLTKINQNASIFFLDYNWSLNE